MYPFVFWPNAFAWLFKCSSFSCLLERVLLPWIRACRVRVECVLVRVECVAECERVLLLSVMCSGNTLH